MQFILSDMLASNPSSTDSNDRQFLFTLTLSCRVGS